MWYRNLAAALAFLVASSAHAQCTPDWRPGEGIPGVNGTVNAVATWDPDGLGPQPPVTVVAGQFSVAGKSFATNVALWSGSAWVAMGSGLPNRVNALAVYNGELVAGMDQLSSTGGPILRRWDGQAWRPLGQDFDGHVYALKEFNGELIVAGWNLTTAGVAIQAWNGSAWHALGTPGVGIGRALAVHAGQLVLGGSNGSRSIAAWDGTAWQPLGTLPSYVFALAEHNGTLYAGSGSVLAWDGSAWNTVGATTNSQVSALDVFDGQLIAGGTFRTISGVGANGIATWDGAAWHALGSGVSASVRALTIAEGSLIVGGGFITADGLGADSVALWDGGSWRPMGTGMSVAVGPLAVFGPDLVAGGNFTTPTPQSGTALTAWDGASWRPFGTGFVGTGTSQPTVFALAVYNGELVAGGMFSAAGGVPAPNIAAFDGQSWRTLNGGVSSSVRSLCVYDGQLVAGGQYSSAGGSPANNIAAWDGASWHPLGTGTSGGSSGSPGSVSALTVYNGELIAAGSFDTAGGVPALNIAAWDGSAWHAMGGGLGGAADYNHVFALAVFNGELYAGGHFATADGQPSPSFARWNGSAWSALLGVNGDVTALGVYNGQLIVGATFNPFPVLSAGVAAFDGTSWHALSSGLRTVPLSAQAVSVRGLASCNGDLFVSGEFFTAGATFAGRVARWGCSCYANCDGSGIPPLLNVGDFVCFLNRFTVGDPYANCDGSTAIPTLNSLDFACFINRFALGCP